MKYIISTVEEIIKEYQKTYPLNNFIIEGLKDLMASNFCTACHNNTAKLHILIKDEYNLYYIKVCDEVCLNFYIIKGL